MRNESLAQILSTLSTPRRVAIMRALMESDMPVNVGMLSVSLDIDHGQTSDNLLELAASGLVMRQKVGRAVYYVPNRELMRQTWEFFYQKENK